MARVLQYRVHLIPSEDAMLESTSAVASLRSYESSPYFHAGLPSKNYDPRGGHCFQVHFEVLSGDSALAAYADIEMGNQGLAEAHTQSFSFHGLEITGDLSLVRECGLAKDSFVNIEMEIPGYWHNFRCVGSVTWIKENAEPGCFRAGVSFLNISQENLNFIVAAIEKFVS